MKRRMIEKERFLVRDDSGKTYELIYTISQQLISSLTGSEWIDGLGRYHLNDNSGVNKLSNTEFELVSLGVKATRI